MRYQYVCNKCQFAWSPIKANDTPLSCPLCASRDILELSGKNDILSNDKVPKTNKLNKALVNEYVVPWMIDI